MISSLKNNFIPSAKGCNNPKGPALLGPLLSCKMAATFLSANVVYMAITSEPITTTSMSTNFSTIKARSSAKSVIAKCIYPLVVFLIISSAQC